MPPLRCHLPAALLSLLAIVLTSATQAAAETGSPAPRWWKGNLHTHSLWSDGDDYPEMIADWYKNKGYDFLALSDHNVMQEGQRWLELKAPVSIGGSVQLRGGGAVLEAYLRRFGPDWVEFRESDGQRSVRLKPLAEYRSLLEEPGRFLLIPSEEVTASWKRPKTATTPGAVRPGPHQCHQSARPPPSGRERARGRHHAAHPRRRARPAGERPGSR
jgi:hypothetical protein